MLDWTFKDFQIINPCHRNGSTEGSRTTIGIQDNGNGNFTVESIKFVGLKYGLVGAYGSDFDRVRNVFFYLCDVGSYFGPGAQQLDITTCDYALCREGAVFEGAPQWHIGSASSFEDMTVSAITIEAKSSGSTRFGLSPSIGGAFYNGKFLVDGSTWFETNSGGNGRVAPRQILFTGDGPFGVPAEGLTVRDAYFIAGGTQQSGGHVTFIEYVSSLVSDQPVIVDDLYMSDPSYANSVFRFTGTAATSKPRLDNVRKPSSVALTDGNVAYKAFNRDGTFHGFTAA